MNNNVGPLHAIYNQQNKLLEIKDNHGNVHNAYQVLAIYETEQRDITADQIVRVQQLAQQLLDAGEILHQKQLTVNWDPDTTDGKHYIHATYSPTESKQIPITQSHFNQISKGEPAVHKPNRALFENSPIDLEVRDKIAGEQPPVVNLQQEEIVVESTQDRLEKVERIYKKDFDGGDYSFVSLAPKITSHVDAEENSPGFFVMSELRFSDDKQNFSAVYRQVMGNFMHFKGNKDPYFAAVKNKLGRIADSKVAFKEMAALDAKEYYLQLTTEEKANRQTVKPFYVALSNTAINSHEYSFFKESKDIINSVPVVSYKIDNTHTFTAPYEPTLFYFDLATSNDHINDMKRQNRGAFKTLAEQINEKLQEFIDKNHQIHATDLPKTLSLLQKTLLNAPVLMEKATERDRKEFIQNMDRVIRQIEQMPRQDPLRPFFQQLCKFSKAVYSGENFNDPQKRQNYAAQVAALISLAGQQLRTYSCGPTNYTPYFDAKIKGMPMAVETDLQALFLAGGDYFKG